LPRWRGKTQYFSDTLSPRADIPVHTFCLPDDVDRLVSAFVGLNGMRRRQFLRSAVAIYTARELSNTLVEQDEGAYSGVILCGRGVRESRKSCAFCANRAVVQCDGDRCVRQLCDDHRWSSAEDLDFCPPCERKVLLAAATPEQIELFVNDAAAERSA
jgi:hypothetical protein